MKKKVNIYPRGPITAVNPPIRVPVKGVIKDIMDIRRCVIAGAKIEEILDDGSVVELNLMNYNKDNTPKETTPVTVVEDTNINLNGAIGTEEETLISTEGEPAEEITEVKEPVTFTEVKESDDGEELETAPDLPAVDEGPKKHLSKKERRELRKRLEATTGNVETKDPEEAPAEEEKIEE